MFSSTRLISLVDKLNLIYLGLLPLGVTFVMVNLYGREQIFLLFLGGTVFVSVYLAVVVSYTPFPKKFWLTMLNIIDAPLIGFLANIGGEQSFSWMIDSFIIDVLVIWGVISWLAVTTNLPGREQRWGSLFFALVALFAVGYLVWPYWVNQVWGDWLHLFWLIVGVIETWGFRYFLLNRDKPLRKEDFVFKYILVFIILWVMVLFLANVLRELN